MIINIYIWFNFILKSVSSDTEKNYIFKHFIMLTIFLLLLKMNCFLKCVNFLPKNSQTKSFHSTHQISSCNPKWKG